MITAIQDGFQEQVQTMQSVLVTGATGFIGRSLVSSLSGNPAVSVTAAVRKNSDTLPDHIKQLPGLDIGPETSWERALLGITHVVHLAGVATSPALQGSSAASAYQQVNVDGTLNLATQAAHAGVKRFVFISSVKVNGELTEQGRPFHHGANPAPEDAYGISKWEAEQGLLELAKTTAMEIVIIRPPLVYGPGVKGNFRSLITWIAKGVPLPLGAIHNKRSLFALDNLVDLVVTCIDHPAAANQVFLVSDGQDLSTTELLRRVGQALGKPARLLPMPSGILTFGASLLGKKAMAQRLCGNLQVDSSYTCETLGWQPPFSVDEALNKTAVAYQTSLPQKTRAPRILRLFDVLFSLSGLILGSPVLLLLLAIGYFDTGSPLFRQERVGRNQAPFTLIKFRTMRPGTASVASHLADTSAITPFGRFLRKTKLDELPQLWNVLRGEMSLVGPRPGLFNQTELLQEREKLNIFAARPGITGLAQVNNIDMSTPRLLAETDQKMLQALTVGDYFKYILQAVAGRGSGDAAKNG